MCLLFYFLKQLLETHNGIWIRGGPIAHQIKDYVNGIEDWKAQDDDLVAFFTVFQRRMHERERIPRKMVEKYHNDITFLVSIDECMMEAMEPRTVWIPALGYEISEQEITSYVDILLRSLKDETKERYMTYEEKYMEVHME